ncbi:MAG: hypothetical protein QOE65_2170 [Solirubrobacteraceae bacterium]|jgi:hypothetical protein|nr:hypothetical protein [Solirubrobacteraceae bacterium]
MRLPAVAIALAAVTFAGCGDAKTKTVTETRTVTVTATTPSKPASDREAIVDATFTFYRLSGSGIPRDQLQVQKTDGTFADVLVATDAHAILKKADDTWLVVFDGNGSIPPETRKRFSIPPEYGG